VHRNSRFLARRLFGSCILAGAVGLFALACGEDAPTDTKTSPEIKPQFSQSVPFNNAGECMNDDLERFGQTGLNCTANDIRIATAIVTKVDGQAYSPGDVVSCSGGGTVDLTITGILLATSNSERGDVGIWVATDNGDAKTGDCNHYNIPTSPLPTGSVNSDADQCGGMQAPSKQTPATTAIDLGIFTVQCSDVQDGFVHIGACLSWTVPGLDNVCPDNADGILPAGTADDFRAATLPGNAAKCNCEGFDVPLVLVGSITIAKDAIPDDAQDFSFDATGTDVSDFDLDDDNDATLNANTTFSNLTPGVRSFVEGAVSGWQLTDITCSGATQSVVTKSVANRSLSIDLKNGESVSCTFTNTKLGSIKVIKDAVPNDAEDFAFSTTGNDLSAFNLDDDADGTLDNFKLFSNLLPGTRTVTEGAESQFDLTALVCTGVASKTTSLADRKATINLAAGEDAICTFTNTKRATVQAHKTVSSGTLAAGQFQFQIRSGATATEEGTTIASGTNDVNGLVTFACVAGNPPCVNVSGVANIVPGNYQFCEVNQLAAWSNNMNGFVPNSDDPFVDNSVECLNITLAAGGSGDPTGIPNPIINTPPPGGDQRTIGYWKTHSCEAPGKQANALGPLLPQTIGDLVMPATAPGCETAVDILNKRQVTGSEPKKASDAAYGLAAQLLAAKLNIAATAGDCGGGIQTYITQAQNLLANDPVNFLGVGDYLGSKVKGALLTLRNTANSLAGTLDKYNNGICP
jgi:hypothetical protein